MPGSTKLRKQLVKMWNENPHCHWCKKLTTLDHQGGRQEPDRATIDHLYSRLDPRRKSVNRTMEKRRLLACYECNQRRCQEEMAIIRAERERRIRLSALGIKTVFD